MSKFVISRRIWLLCVVAAIAAVAICGYMIFRDPACVQITWPSNSPDEQRSLVLTLLRQEVDDEHNWRRINGWKSSHIIGSLSQNMPYRVHRVAFAAERVTQLGRAALDVLLNIAQDPSVPYEMRLEAWKSLSHFYDPRILPAISKATSDGMLKTSDLSWLLSMHLPVEWSDPRVDSNAVLQWLNENVIGRPFEEVALSLLDERMASSSSDVPLIMRWLNRHYEEDLDIWLQKRTPRGARFRTRELEKGYDPAQFTRLHRQTVSLSYGIAVLYCRESDRQDCADLINNIWDERTRYPIAWDSVKAWYKANRDQLIFDESNRRFEVAGMREPTIDTFAK